MTSLSQIPQYLAHQTGHFLDWYSRQPLTFIGTTGSIMLMTQSLLQCNPQSGLYHEWGCRWSLHPMVNGMMFIFIGAGIHSYWQTFLGAIGTGLIKWFTLFYVIFYFSDIDWSENYFCFYGYAFAFVF